MDYLMYTGKHYVTHKVKAGPAGEVSTVTNYWARSTSTILDRTPVTPLGPEKPKKRACRS
jgi:hypothetical protein